MIVADRHCPSAHDLKLEAYFGKMATRALTTQITHHPAHYRAPTSVLEPAIWMSTQIWGCHVLWLRSATNREVLVGSLPFCFGLLHLASSDLPGDPSGDISAGWGRAGRIEVIALGRPCMVTGGGLCRATVERSG